MDFLDSSFFASTTEPARKTCLPTPSEVLARSKDSKSTSQPTPVKFESLDLLVKFGPHVVVEEALCLNMIYDGVPVPVPEVYGWRVEGDCVFIYMQLVRGESLHDRWDSLSGPGKVSICDQLREIVVLLGQIEQEDPSDRFIGMYAIRTLSNDYLLMKYCIQGQSPVDHYPTMCLRICHQAVLSGLPKSSMTGFLHSPSAGSPIHKNTAIRIESFCRTMEPYGLPTETCIGATL